MEKIWQEDRHDEMPVGFFLCGALTGSGCTLFYIYGIKLLWYSVRWLYMLF